MIWDWTERFALKSSTSSFSFSEKCQNTLLVERPLIGCNSYHNTDSVSKLYPLTFRLSFQHVHQVVASSIGHFTRISHITADGSCSSGPSHKHSLSTQAISFLMFSICLSWTVSSFGCVTLLAVRIVFAVSLTTDSEWPTAHNAAHSSPVSKQCWLRLVPSLCNILLFFLWNWKKNYFPEVRSFSPLSPPLSLLIHMEPPLFTWEQEAHKQMIINWSWACFILWGRFWGDTRSAFVSHCRDNPFRRHLSSPSGHFCYYSALYSRTLNIDIWTISGASH